MATEINSSSSNAENNITPTFIKTPKPFDEDKLKSMYGIEHLVDFTAINEADHLLTECERFIADSKNESSSMNTLMPMFSRPLKSWNAKRRDSRLTGTYQVLSPRVAETETILRTIIGEVAEKKTVLRIQARMLISRLEECIKYNRELLGSTDIPLEETRIFVNVLSSESSLLKHMVGFNREILRIRASQQLTRQHGALLRWGNKNKPYPDVDPTTDNDHLEIDSRLVKFRDLREKFVQYLAHILEKRGQQQANLDNCIWSLEAIRAAMKRDGVDESRDEAISLTYLKIRGNDGVTKDSLKFDHSRCVDCSYGYSITCECMSHFSTLQKQAQAANQKLQQLVEVREKMREIYEDAINQGQEEGHARVSFRLSSRIGVLDSLTPTTSKTDEIR